MIRISTSLLLFTIILTLGWRVVVFWPGFCGIWATQTKALKRSEEVHALATSLAHPNSLALVHSWAAALHQLRGEVHTVHEQAQAALSLSDKYEFAFFAAHGMVLSGWALVEQNRDTTGIEQIRHGITAYRATGAELERPHWRALLAEAYGRVRQPADGLSVLAETLTEVDATDNRYYEAELYRLKGELLLAQTGSRPQVEGDRENTEEAEECFQQAIAIARKQQAKSLELRTATSLARLWQQQGKIQDARELLASIYNWFTEGFDTKDLQQAKIRLESLNHRTSE